MSTTIGFTIWVRLRAYARSRNLKLSEALDELLGQALPPDEPEPEDPAAIDA